MLEISQCWLKDRCKRSKACPTPFCMKLFKLDQLCSQALLTMPQRQHLNLRIDADGTDRAEFLKLKQIEADVKNFIDNGENLYIYSHITGNGKTAWLLRLLNSYLESIWIESDIKCRALFINVPRYLLALKASINKQDPYVDHVQANILDADLVVFDEIGTKVVTTYEHENLLSIINTRIEEGKSNFYSSNLAPEELREVVGDRLYSRIVNCSTNIELNGRDKRVLR